MSLASIRHGMDFRLSIPICWAVTSAGKAWFCEIYNFSIRTDIEASKMLLILGL